MDFREEVHYKSMLKSYKESWFLLGFLTRFLSPQLLKNWSSLLQEPMPYEKYCLSTLLSIAVASMCIGYEALGQEKI